MTKEAKLLRKQELEAAKARLPGASLLGNKMRDASLTIRDIDDAIYVHYFLDEGRMTERIPLNHLESLAAFIRALIARYNEQVCSINADAIECKMTIANLIAVDQQRAN